MTRPAGLRGSDFTAAQVPLSPSVAGETNVQDALEHNTLNANDFTSLADLIEAGLIVVGSGWSATHSYIQPGTPYLWYSAALLRPTNGYVYAAEDKFPDDAATFRLTDSMEPTWPTVVGDSVSDGDYTWFCIAAEADWPSVPVEWTAGASKTPASVIYPPGGGGWPFINYPGYQVTQTDTTAPSFLRNVYYELGAIADNDGYWLALCPAPGIYRGPELSATFYEQVPQAINTLATQVANYLRASADGAINRFEAFGNNGSKNVFEANGISARNEFNAIGATALNQFHVAGAGALNRMLSEENLALRLSWKQVGPTNIDLYVMPDADPTTGAGLSHNTKAIGLRYNSDTDHMEAYLSTGTGVNDWARMALYNDAYVTVQTGVPTTTFITPLVKDDTAVTGGTYAWDGAAYVKIGPLP